MESNITKLITIILGGAIDLALLVLKWEVLVNSQIKQEIMNE